MPTAADCLTDHVVSEVWLPVEGVSEVTVRDHVLCYISCWLRLYTAVEQKDLTI